MKQSIPEEKAEEKVTEEPKIEAAPTPAAPAPAPAPVAPVATGSLNGPMPAELNHWSWSAFLLNWIWGIAHNVWIALLMFVPFVNFFVSIYLGIKGNELAWENRKFESVDQFKAVQRIWTNWGIGIWVVSFIITIFTFSMMIALISGALFSGGSKDTGSSKLQDCGTYSSFDCSTPGGFE